MTTFALTFARVFRPESVHAERERQTPSRDVVKTVAFLVGGFAAQFVAAETLHIIADERLVLRRVLFEQSLDPNFLRLIQVNDVRTGGKSFVCGGRIFLKIGVRRV